MNYHWYTLVAQRKVRKAILFNKKQRHISAYRLNTGMELEFQSLFGFSLAEAP